MAMLHNGRNIAYDALEANRDVEVAARSSTGRGSAVPVDLVWESLTFDVPAKKKKAPDTVPDDQLASMDASPQGMKRVLHGVSGSVHTGQVLAILGSTGAGKSTVLNLLSGRVKSGSKCVSGGRVLVNGAKRDFNSWRQISKFVEQDDTNMFAELTVREQLTYAASLSLPASMSSELKRLRVEKVIQELGLSKCADTFVGSELVRGVSGGERRRCAIGIELVTDPSLLFLDEPTSGLDSFNALNVMTSLRHLACNGRTIVTTIHQPRSSIFALFDQLLLLSEGRVAFFGPAKEALEYFSRLGFRVPKNYNVADFAIDVLSVDYRSETLEKATKARVAFLAQEHREKVEPKLLEESLSALKDTPGTNSDNSSKSQLTFANNPVREFVLLAKRAVLLVTRERQTNISRFIQTILLGILLGLIWLGTGNGTNEGDRRGVLGAIFFVIINSTFDQSFSVIFAFAKERAVVNRERSSGMYRVLSFFISKQLVELPRILFFNLLTALLVYFMSAFKRTVGAFFTFLLIIIMCADIGSSISSALSVFAGDEQIAAAVVPVALIVNILVGGLFIAKEAAPGFVKWAFWASFVYYAYNAGAANELGGRGADEVDNKILDGLNGFSTWENIAFLFGFVVLYKTLYLLALISRNPKFDHKI